MTKDTGATLMSAGQYKYNRRNAYVALFVAGRGRDWCRTVIPVSCVRVLCRW